LPQPVQPHAGEPAPLDDARLGRAVDPDLDALLLGVLELPLGRLEEAARLARHDFDAVGAEPEAGAAAVHGGVADADDEDALADLVDVSEGDRLEPGDADVNVGGAGLAPRELELLALGGARADEHRVEPPVGEELAQTLDLRSEEHTSELQSLTNLVCRLLLEKNKADHGDPGGGHPAGGAPLSGRGLPRRDQLARPPRHLPRASPAHQDAHTGGGGAGRLVATR